MPALDLVLDQTEFTRLTATREREFMLVGVRNVSGTQSRVYCCLRAAAGTYTWVQVVSGA